MANIQTMWAKFSSNELLIGIGAAIIIISFVLGLIVGYGLGGDTLGLLGAIAVLVILYLKYSPNQVINWPAPVPVINLAISAVVAVLALLDVLRIFQFLGFLGGYAVALLVFLVGAGIMVWGAYQEWNATKTASPPAG